MDIQEHSKRLGRRAIADRLGVGVNAVGEAVRAGAYPASWYPAICALSAMVGAPAPMALFRWKALAADAASVGHVPQENPVSPPADRDAA